VVELEDDLVLVVVGTARPEDVRAEVAREPGACGRDPRDPLFELFLASLLHPPRRHRRNRRIVGSDRIPAFQRLAQEFNPGKLACNRTLLNPTSAGSTTRRRKNTSTEGLEAA